ncbi:LytTR family transcriptional regulator DNA-binding domain-containing protein [Terrimonas sp. NA20]|uniref:LytTR family transcriptional regulator DNA-binding domain-containing protein n=1 Tax=Terrimonas ginsenosidimutans TaxID=2908004 RepID=A0ABS9KR17_9BACT|nr:LytTR family transcriptional regulator DNA-binding domain-containing protein [Terrimonas ginsenosidimutans]MCG2614780.1 LytTR family transcriptional regulator DNA-binding domain-containing protein [Terrimonas ginsenosidimutans]
MNQLYKAILVDDEPAARRLMKNLLLEYHELVQVVGEAGTGEEAIQKIQSLQPDLIFLDIQMPDLTGFEVIERLSNKPNIIFTTAYEQYAMKAFETFSIDYLLKPIKEERLTQSMEKLKRFGKLNATIDVLGLQEMIRQIQTPKQATALSIRTGDRIILLRFDQIVFLESQDKYVYIYTAEGQKHLTDQTLSALEEKLPEQFFRIQKSFLINKDRIKEMHRHFNGRYLFVMDDKAGSRITSGRTYYEMIKTEFGL